MRRSFAFPRKRTVISARRWLSLALALLTLSLAVTTSAETRKFAVVAEGADAKTLDQDLTQVIGGKAEAIDSKAFAAELKKAGQKAPVIGSFASEKQRDATLANLATAATATSASGVILASTSWEKGKRQARVLFFDVPTKTIKIDTQVAWSKTADARRATLSEVLGPALEPPPPPAPIPTPIDVVERPKEVAEEERTKEPDLPTANLLEAGLYLVLGGREFKYEGAASNNLRSYDVFPTAMPKLSVRVYPLARTTVPVLQDLGLVASYGRAIGLESQAAGSPVVDTTWDEMTAGLRFRIHTAKPGLVFGVTGLFGMNRFLFENAGALSDEAPSVSYKYLAGLLDGRIPFGKLNAFAELGFLAPLSSGTTYNRFSDASVLGLTGTLGGGFAVAPVLELRLAVEYTRFFATFHPKAGDTYVADGAADEYLRPQLGVVALF